MALVVLASGPGDIRRRVTYGAGEAGTIFNRLKKYFPAFTVLVGLLLLVGAELKRSQMATTLASAWRRFFLCAMRAYLFIGDVLQSIFADYDWRRRRARSGSRPA